MSQIRGMSRVPKSRVIPPPLDIRKALEGFDTIEVADPIVYDMVAEQAPELIGKLPPRKPAAPSIRKRAPANRRKKA